MEVAGPLGTPLGLAQRVSSLCVGLYRWLVKVSWLGKLVLVFWWVELYFFSLECNVVLWGTQEGQHPSFPSLPISSINI